MVVSIRFKKQNGVVNRSAPQGPGPSKAGVENPPPRLRATGGRKTHANVPAFSSEGAPIPAVHAARQLSHIPAPRTQELVESA